LDSRNSQRIAILQLLASNLAVPDLVFFYHFTKAFRIRIIVGRLQHFTPGGFQRSGAITGSRRRSESVLVSLIVDMRLLNSRKLQLEEFIGDANVPPYAILSHTWGKEEVTLQDMVSTTGSFRKKKGFKKIQYCCSQALADKLYYAWVDTYVLFPSF
jgi:hypothetical protein